MKKDRDGGVWILPTPGIAVLLLLLSAAVLAGVIVVLAGDVAPLAEPPRPAALPTTATMTDSQTPLRGATVAQDPDAPDPNVREEAPQPRSEKRKGHLVAWPPGKRPNVTFSPAALDGSGLSSEIAEGMADLVERTFDFSYPFNLEQSPNSQQRHRCDFLFAAWPQLGRLIASGKVKPEIRDFAGNPPGCIIWGGNPSKRLMTMAFALRGTAVSLSFADDADNPAPGLYARIFEAAEESAKARAQQR